MMLGLNGKIRLRVDRRQSAPLWLRLFKVRGSCAGLIGLMLCGCSNPYFDEAQKAVEAHLTDPGSAQFRNLREGKYDVCGEFNAKNVLGGYVGFKPFAWSIKAGKVMTVGESGQNIDMGNPEAKLFQSVPVDRLCEYDR